MTRASPQLARGQVPAELARGPQRGQVWPRPRSEPLLTPAPERRPVLEWVSISALAQQERPQPARRRMMPGPR